MDNMVNDVFEALFALTDLRMLLRETAPFHELNEEQRAHACEALNRAKTAVVRIEKELQR